MFWRVVKYLTFGFVTLCLLVTLAICAVLEWPSLVLNAKTAGWASAYLRVKGIYIDWYQLDLHTESRSFFEKKLSLNARDLCVRVVAEKTNVCFRTVKFSAVASLHGLKPKVEEIGPIELLEGGIEYRPEADRRVAEESLSNKSIGLPKWVTDARFLGLVVDVVRSDVNVQGYRIQGQYRLESHSDSGRLTTWKAVARGQAARPNENYKFKLDGSVESHDGKTVYAFDLLASENKRQLDIKTKGTFEPEHWSGVITGNAQGFVDALDSLKVDDCRWDIKPKVTSVENTHLECPAVVQIALSKDSRKLYPNFVRDMKGTLTADLKAPWVNGRPESIEGRLGVVVAPLFAKIDEGRGVLSVDVAGNMKDFPRGWKINSNLDAGIEKFQNVVHMLEKTPWAVPEPFNSLRGRVSLKASAEGILAKDTFHIPISFTTNLHSKIQRFDLQGDGKVSYTSDKETSHTHLDLKIGLSDVRLGLPHLNLEAPPRLYPDSRITSSGRRSSRQRDPASQSKSSFTYDISVETPSGKPMHLVSNLATGDVPLHLNLKATSGNPLSGTIKIVKFPLELFRRKATFEYFDLILGDEVNPSEIRGEITVAYTDYTIKILLSGQVDKPVYKLTSDPPLPENKLVSVLLFGRPMEVLGPGEMESVANARAAIERNAISLASMYVLASTPVESVGYDPSTGYFSAKVRLADGMSLDFGSGPGFRESMIGIRKRLNAYWTINTYLENDATLDHVRHTLTSFLEWSNRY